MTGAKETITADDVTVDVVDPEFQFLDGIGALIDLGYMDRPITEFQIVARYDSVRTGYAASGYSDSSGVGYSGVTKVEKPNRGVGIGSLLFDKKMEMLEDMGAHTVHAMITTNDGRRLVEDRGFLYNEPLSVRALDEYYTREL